MSPEQGYNIIPDHISRALDYGMKIAKPQKTADQNPYVKNSMLESILGISVFESSAISEGSADVFVRNGWMETGFCSRKENKNEEDC